ncbi:kinase-like domain-containing protein [Suillus ampliporus]|nr:kinase-like domain-containing protein [Suillus ampliporus]
MLRELQVWLMLNPSTIVPLLGTACRVDSPLLALVSEWMPFGTLKEYLETHATTLNSSDRIELVRPSSTSIAFNKFRSKSVVHGDLHPGNVLIDSEGKPRLTDFGLATVVGDPDLQWGTTTAARPLNAQWRAPEVIGIENEPAKPTFESDIYSLGSVIFFIFSEHAPWENKNFSQISIELSRKATPTRPKDVTNHHWNLIQKCWSRNPDHRPTPKEVFENIDQFGNDDSQVRQPNHLNRWQIFIYLIQPSISNQPVDLTGQINGDVKDFAGGGAFTNVYKCECKELTGTIQVWLMLVRHRCGC